MTKKANMQQLIKDRKKPAASTAEDTKLKMFTFRANAAAFRELSMLAAETERTKQELLQSALNDLFVKHGRNPIA